MRITSSVTERGWQPVRGTVNDGMNERPMKRGRKRERERRWRADPSIGLHG